MDERLVEGARIILDYCLGLKFRERIAIVCDPDRGDTARALAGLARERDAETILLEGYYTFDTVDDLHAAMVKAVDSSDVTIYLVSPARTQLLGHADLRRAASARGARQAFVTSDIRGLSEGRLEECRRNTLRVGQLLTQAEYARVTSSLGTDVTMRLSRRKALCLTPVLRDPGDWGALPTYVEAAIGVAEGSAEGVAVIDGMITDLGPVSRPVMLTISGGVVTRIDGGREADELRRTLDAAGENAYIVAELGVGTNPYATERIGGFEDKKIFGTVHLGLGDGTSFGSRLRSRIHLDVLMERPTLELDGRPLLQDGRPVA